MLFYCRFFLLVFKCQLFTVEFEDLLVCLVKFEVREDGKEEEEFLDMLNFVVYIFIYLIIEYFYVLGRLEGFEIYQ